jgi:predicted lipoprotein with Yx(FWY)xxD motif
MTRLLSARLLAVGTAICSARLLVAVAEASSSSHSGSRALIALRKTALGTILVDLRGRTLYVFDKDRMNASMCDSAGHPLYLFIGDKRPGQAAGEGLTDFGAEWYAVAANGHTVEKSSNSGSPSGPGYGSGY